MANLDIFSKKDIEKANIKFYSNKEFGAVDGWQSIDAQASNYEILVDGAGGLEPKQRILDIGCGSGQLYRGLNSRDGIDYVGIDLQKEVISSLKKEFKKDKNRFLYHTLDSYLEKEKPQIFDYVFASGTYNVKVDDNDMEEYLYDQIGKMWGLAKYGVVFNCTSIYAYAQNDNIQYYHPVSVFTHCMTKSDRVALLHDYTISEFTIYMYR